MKRLLYALNLFVLGGAGNVATMAAIPAPVSMVVIDTYGYDAYAYRNLQFLARSVGFTVRYKNLYGLIEYPQIPTCDVAVFIINNEMLTNPEHPLIKEWINALHLFVQQPNKSIALLVPKRLKITKNTSKQITTLLQKIELLPQKRSALSKTSAAFLDTLKTESAIGSRYGTSLLPAKPNTTASVQHTLILRSPTTDAVIARTTPYDTTPFSTVAQQTLPAGLMWQLPEHNTTVLLCPSHVFTFADIEEECMKVPIKTNDRNELLTIAQQLLTELYNAHVTHSLELQPTKRPSLPPLFLEAEIIKTKEKAEQKINKTVNQSLYKWVVTEGISCAWIDPHDLFGQEDPHKKLPKQIRAALKKELHRNPFPADVESVVEEYALDTGMNFLYDASFNLWWVTYLPEYYLVPQGRFRHQEEEFIKQTDIITEAIPQYALQKNKKIPKNFVGLNLTSNFKHNPVQHAVSDVYGNTYSQIPCPLDWDNFWYKEVVEPFNLFADLAAGLPIDGVCLDFEMYHAQTQASTYDDIVDFSDYAWQLYCRSVNTIAATKHPTVAHRVAYLAHEKKFTQYFKILEKEAEKIGTKLKKAFRTNHPQLLIAAYAPTLPNSWFYRGLLRGLSSAQEPIIYATFNTDYYSHHNWLTAQGIHLLHGSALMLSKFKNKQSFDLIAYTKSHHYFVWYNHPSRMVYGYTQQELDHNNWWGIEGSPLSAPELAFGIAHASQ